MDSDSDELRAKYLAEAEAATENARRLRFQADLAELDYLQTKRAHEFMLAQDSQNNHYHFDDEIDFETTSACMRTLKYWHMKDPHCDITITFNSPGGQIIEGMALVDFLVELKKDHHLTTVCRGMAASMAGILFQLGHHRKQGKYSVLLVHQGTASAQGTIGQIEDAVELSRMLRSQLLDILAERSTLSREEIAAKWERRDWWLDSDQSLAAGFCDEVVS